MIVWLSTKLRSGDDKETMGVPMKDDAGLLGSLKPYSAPEVDRILFWVYYSRIPIYPIFYLLKGYYIP